MTWRSLGVVVLVAFAACQKPNLEATEGGYGGRTIAPTSATQADTSTPSPADTAAPAAADTATL